MGSLGIPSQDFTHPLISERAIDEPRPLKVIHVGAGASGICAAIQFPRHVPNLELVIYEKNPDVGGTWFENRSVTTSTICEVFRNVLTLWQLSWVRLW